MPPPHFPPLLITHTMAHIDMSYVTVLDKQDGFVVGDENRQVNKGMKMTIVSSHDSLGSTNSEPAQSYSEQV